MRRRSFLAVLSLAGVPVLSAHAILREATPSPKKPATGPDVPVSLKFNSKIDGKRSKLTVIAKDQTTQELTIEQPTPDHLTATARGLKPGSYRLRWQVLAADGHITRGEVPFQVQ